MTFFRKLIPAWERNSILKYCKVSCPTSMSFHLKFYLLGVIPMWMALFATSSGHVWFFIVFIPFFPHVGFELSILFDMIWLEYLPVIFRGFRIKQKTENKYLPKNKAQCLEKMIPNLWKLKMSNSYDSELIPLNWEICTSILLPYWCQSKIICYLQLQNAEIFLKLYNDAAQIVNSIFLCRS